MAKLRERRETCLGCGVPLSEKKIFHRSKYCSSQCGDTYKLELKKKGINNAHCLNSPWCEPGELCRCEKHDKENRT